MKIGVPVAINVDCLVVCYGDTLAVNGVSFQGFQGEVTALLGPNGAGKTTTIETLEGYIKPTSGSVRVLGLDPIADHKALVPRLGVMLQSGGVYPGIRPLEALQLFASYYDNPLDPKTLLENVGLTHRARASWRTLSGGEKQRLSLALAIIGRPDIVFLDEPSAGLDVEGRRLVHTLIRELRHDGVTFILGTHDLVEAEALADRIVIMNHGLVVADASIDDLLVNHPPDIRFSTSAQIELKALTHHLGHPVEMLGGGSYLVKAPPDPELIAALTAWLAANEIVLGSLHGSRIGLEDLFLRLTRGDKP